MTPDQINFMNIISVIATVRIANYFIRECLCTESTLVDSSLLVCPSLTTCIVHAQVKITYMLHICYIYGVPNDQKLHINPICNIYVTYTT